MNQKIIDLTKSYFKKNTYKSSILKYMEELSPKYLNSININLENDEIPLFAIVHKNLSNKKRYYFLVSNKYIRYQNLFKEPPWYVKGIMGCLTGAAGVSYAIPRNTITGKINLTPIFIKKESTIIQLMIYWGNEVYINNTSFAFLRVGMISNDKKLVVLINGFFNELKNILII